MGRGGGRKERSNVDFSPGYGERERRSGWGVAPPSRKLWVGNLSPDITESILSEHFLRFGEIESITYSSGRSFAYINFKKEEDAVLALRGLQGSNVSGMPLRIEFAKGDKDYLQHKGDRFSTERTESHFRRELRSEHVSPEKSSDKSKGYKSAEISEVLWVGFPSFLNVDEMMLRRAFSPFGEIEKITTFPGRSYAFVRYRSVVAACRAKEALHGKLFNNPRVSICFARSDIPAEHGKDFARSPVRPSSKLNFLPGSSGQVFEAFPGDRSFESPVRELHRASPSYGSHFDRVPRDAHALDFDRNNSFRFSAERGAVGAEAYGYARLRDFNKDRILEDVYERQRSSPEERVRPWRNLSSERPHRVPHLLDSLNAEDRSFPLAKKLKIDYIPDKDLPEYPFSDLEPEKHDALQKQFADFPEHHGYNRALDSIPITLKGANDHSRNLTRTRVEIDGSRNNIHSLSVGAGPLPITSKLPIFIPETHKAPALDNIWKWEGTLAKGGTPVCRARCFPVGKVLDFMLPEFLNCTARTGLDMLAKHYYQAAGTWVVFFVPETDADISFYNEFMHYLGDKQRAAVAKLGEKVTLFLVPPSDFSEQVLKVPGKVSISGVVLKFQQNAPKLSSVLQPMNVMDQKVSSLIQRPNEVLNFHESLAFSKANSPEFRSFSHNRQNLTGLSSGYSLANISSVDDSFPLNFSVQREKQQEAHKDGRYDQQQFQNPQLTSSWSRNIPISNSRMGSFSPAPNAPSQAPGQFYSAGLPLASSRVEQATLGYMPEILAATSVTKAPPQLEIKPQPSSATAMSLQHEQLAQLAAILGKQKQSGEEHPFSNDEMGKHSNLLQNRSSQSQMAASSNSPLMSHPHSSVPPVNSSLPSASIGQQIGSKQQLHLQVAQPSDVPPAQNLEQQNNQQAPNSSSEETEADPEKRLQATLQLAAALLQQIQQRSKPVG